MGGTESKKEFSIDILQNFHKKYEFERHCDDPIFGSIEIHRSLKSDCKMMIIKRNFHSQIELKEFSNEIKLRSGLEHPNILTVVGCQKIIGESICGEIIRIEIFSEYYHHNLLKEIIKRQNNLVKLI